MSYPDNMNHSTLDHDQSWDEAVVKATQRVDAAIEEDFLGYANDYGLDASVFGKLAEMVASGQLTSGKPEDVLAVGCEVCMLVGGFREKRIFADSEIEHMNR